MEIVIHNIDEKTVKALQAQARSKGIELEEYLRRRLDEMTGPLAKVQAIRATAPSGHSFHIKYYCNRMSCASSEAFEDEVRITQKAANMCSPLNGARWSDARVLLEEAGFEVFFE